MKDQDITTNLEEKYPRYYLVNLAFRWAKEIKRKEANKHRVVSEIVDQAIQDIMNGKINPDFIENLPKEDEIVLEDEIEIETMKEAAHGTDEDEGKKLKRKAASKIKKKK